MQLKILLGQFVLRPLWENISHSPTTAAPSVVRTKTSAAGGVVTGRTKCLQIIRPLL